MKTYGYDTHRDLRGKVAHFLVMDREMIDRLPPDSGNGTPPFDAEIIDLKTGKVYRCKEHWVAIEEDPFGAWDDEKQDMVEAWTLNQYFYSGHWCPCHRISSIEDANPDAELDVGDSDEESCPSGRFYVTKLTHPALPGHVLFYEDVPEEWLEKQGREMFVAELDASIDRVIERDGFCVPQNKRREF